ncbi:MAG TPA: TonB family protein [Casimicrobium huifangae]|jgi:protein TonB|uniref:energy transducer TonB n=1 Tax=Casimicrobium huifangae TaxID=2591109 RepID=UPI002C443F6F|nr:TonB family protein [Casimicrobium huifangae]
MSAFEDPPAPLFNRTVMVTVAVVAFHAVALWLLQTGLLRRAVELVVPAEVIAEFVEPPRPKDEPPPPPPALAQKPQPVAPAPRLAAIADPTPTPNAPVGVIDPPPAPLPPIAAPIAPAPPAPVAIPPAPPAAPAIQLPSSDADYLQNPKPPYPPMSKRLNEQGTVVMRVLIGADGQPQKAEIRKSSGFERLDRSAAETVMKWRYVPGKRAGVAEAMWFNVPINFVLE